MILKRTLLAAGYLLLLIKVYASLEICEVLKSLLDNFENSSSISHDVYFGLSLSRALIKGSLRKKDDTQSENLIRFKEITVRRITEIIRNKSVENFSLLSSYQRIILQTLSTNQAWNISIYVKLIRTPPIATSFEQYMKQVDTGIPSPNTSDECLAQILSIESCAMSTVCSEILDFSNKNSYGYHRTHQILLALIIKHRGCTSWIPLHLSMKIILQNLCYEVYKEVIVISSNGIPQFLRDLYLEETLFCAISGFTEFIRKDVIENILSWRGKHGCFVYTEDYDDCASHITGLGVGYLGFLLSIT